MAYHQLRIAKIVQETPDARSFVLEVPADLAAQFKYRAGQFLTFKVPHEQGTFNRCYSLSSAPGLDARHKVTVKRSEGGLVSNWICSSLDLDLTLSDNLGFRQPLIATSMRKLTPTEIAAIPRKELP